MFPHTAGKRILRHNSHLTLNLSFLAMQTTRLSVLFWRSIGPSRSALVDYTPGRRCKNKHKTKRLNLSINPSFNSYSVPKRSNAKAPTDGFLARSVADHR